MLGQFLQDAGCRTVHHQAYAIDYSYGAEAYEACRRDTAVTFKLAQSQMIALGLVTNEEYEKLYEQMLVDIMQETLRALTIIVSAWRQTASATSTHP
jgi:hypothetical protein